MKSQPLETVAIEGPRGTPLVINASDYDPARHRLFQERPADPPVKRGRGRPPETPGETLCSVGTRLRKDEADALYRAAQRQRMTVSEYLRSLVRRSVA